MATMNEQWAEMIVEELVRNEVTCFCISPGSRSTPLVLAAARHAETETVVHYDERGAAYYALGHARATGKPAVLICTSGSAVANYLPAVIEGSMDCIPIIVLSADRPPELHDSGSNQTINQAGLFDDFVRWKVDLCTPCEAITSRFVLTTIDQAVYRSRRSPAGPVHINCMFREPLISDDAMTSDDGDELSAWRESGTPLTGYGSSLMALDDVQLQGLAGFLREESNGILVVGRLVSEREREAVLRLARQLNWPTLPDISSGLRLGVEDRCVIPYYDLMLLSLFSGLAGRKTVLHIGGRIISKRLLQLLDSDQIENYIRIADHPFRYDPNHRVTSRIEANITDSCFALASLIDRHENESLVTMQKQSSAVDRIVEDMTSQGNINEPAVCQLISKNIHDLSALWLSSSLPIREMDSFAAFSGPAVPVGCNRGASGIDGTIASAVGYARGFDRPVTVLIGDLAALHDLNSLSLVRNSIQPIVLVVINNNGGGLFSFLPAAEKKDVFESFFATPHDLTFETAAKMFDLNYHCPSTREEFVTCYTKAQKATGKTLSSIIEVTCDRQENFDLQQEIAQVVGKVLDEL